MLHVETLAQVLGFITTHRPTIPAGKAVRVAAAVAVEHRGETISLDEIDPYLVPAPYLPPDDDEARTASDHHEHDFYRRSE